MCKVLGLDIYFVWSVNYILSYVGWNKESIYHVVFSNSSFNVFLFPILSTLTKHEHFTLL